MSTLQPREKQLTTYVTVGILCVHFPLNTVAPPLQPAAPSLLPSVELSSLTYDKIHTENVTAMTQKMTLQMSGAYPEIWITEREGVGSRSLPLSLGSPSPYESNPLPLEIGHLNPLGGLGKCCKLPQRGLGQSTS